MNVILDNTFGERVAATYKTESDALRAKTILKTKFGLKDTTVKIITPTDQQLGKKLEGSDKSIERQYISMHIVYPIVSFVLGMILALILVNFGPELTQKNPVFTYIALISPSLFLGAFFAGMYTLKPGHIDLNQKAIRAKEKNQWTVVVDSEEASISKSDIADELSQTQVKQRSN